MKFLAADTQYPDGRQNHCTFGKKNVKFILKL